MSSARTCYGDVSESMTICWLRALWSEIFTRPSHSQVEGIRVGPLPLISKLPTRSDVSGITPFHQGCQVRSRLWRTIQRIGVQCRCAGRRARWQRQRRRDAAADKRGEAILSYKLCPHPDPEESFDICIVAVLFSHVKTSNSFPPTNLLVNTKTEIKRTQNVIFNRIQDY